LAVNKPPAAANNGNVRERDYLQFQLHGYTPRLETTKELFRRLGIQNYPSNASILLWQTRFVKLKQA
jgi:hypothetical protein